MRLSVPFANVICLLLGAAIVAPGCGQRAGEYTPAPEAARASLEAALTAWRDGVAPRAIDSKPKVQVVDTQRRPGQTLRSFEVLSETSLAGEGRCYVVGLSFDSPAASERARFVVVGIDPIWVFRKDDYDKLSHWEHPMEETEPAPAGEESPSTSTSTPISNERS
jgi:hypothetical protein